MKTATTILRTLPLLAALLLAGRPLCAQSTASDPALGSLPGTDYYVGFLQNEDGRGAAFRELTIRITSEVSTIVYVDIPNAGLKSYITQPGEVISIPVSGSLELRVPEEVGSNAIHVFSRAPVSVCAVNARYQSAGTYSVTPVSSWGRYYLSMTLPNADGGRTGEFAVVAAYDSTRVTIRPTVNTDYTNAGQDITVYLQKGETFLVKAAPDANADLSGSEISATRPVGLICGHIRTPVVPTGTTITSSTYSSHLAMMMMPDSLWGKEYFTVPQRGTGDRFRLMPTVDGTRIYITHYNGTSVDRDTLLKAKGQVTDISSVKGKPISGPVYWRMTAPTMLLHLRTGAATFASPDDAPGMLPEAPLDQMSSRSVFTAPAEIGGDKFDTHTLILLAKGSPAMSPADTNNPLRFVTLDGTPLHTVNPLFLTQRIGATDYYYAAFPIPPGGHLLTSKNGYPVTGMLTGSNGLVARDNYLFGLPFWMQQVGPDVTPPHPGERVPGQSRELLSIRISDRTAEYFSGVSGVEIVGSPGWQLLNFTTPNPDDDATATFRAVSDPSGPLSARLTDRDKNSAMVKLSDGICFKTAFADRDSVGISANQGKSGIGSIVLRTNQCGDKASVRSITLTGTAGNYAGISTDLGNAPLSIPPAGTVTITLSSSASTPQGAYSGELRVEADDSVIVIPVSLTVIPPAGVTGQDDPASGLSVSVTPNPVTSAAVISLNPAHTGYMRVTVSTPYGETVAVLLDRPVGPGTRALTWHTDGVPNGVYFCRVQTVGGTAVARIIVVK